jgi:hypothetical protein
LSKVLLIISLFYSVQSFANVTCGGGVEFSEGLNIQKDNGQSSTLNLNGVGLKKVFLFNVFYAALYLETSMGKSGASIINSNETKVGIIHTLRGISKKQLIDLWDEEFERLCGDESSCKKMLPHHNRFLSYFRDLKKNERLYLIAFPDRFEVEINKNEGFPAIFSPQYSRLLQNSLFGPNAADARLKKGILGQKKVCKA